MRIVPRLYMGGTKGWTPVLFLGVMVWLPFRSSVRSQVQTQVRKEPAMRRYVITCEFYRAKRAALIDNCIREISSEWERPLAGLWLINTSLSAGDIRSALLSNLDFQDRLYVCEIGADAAAFNALPSSGGNVMNMDDARAKNRILTGIFSRDGRNSRHLRAA